jgi:hypothetical protein
VLGVENDIVKSAQTEKLHESGIREEQERPHSRVAGLKLYAKAVHARLRQLRRMNAQT